MALLLLLVILLSLSLFTLSFWTRKDNSNSGNGDGVGIRGVLSHYQSKYSDDDARLICDSNKILKINDINDGYCDCDDGFDEPGTSACIHGNIIIIITITITNITITITNITTILGKFHCNNKGFKSIVLASSRVDDGICDCCDGSDEGTVIQCKDTCNQVAYKERELMNKLTAAYKVGKSLRDGYITSVRNEKESKAATLTYVKGEIERQKATTSALQKEKDNEETQIKDKQKALIDSNKNKIKVIISNLLLIILILILRMSCTLASTMKMISFTFC